MAMTFQDFIGHFKKTAAWLGEQDAAQQLTIDELVGANNDLVNDKNNLFKAMGILVRDNKVLTTDIVDLKEQVAALAKEVEAQKAVVAELVQAVFNLAPAPITGVTVDAVVVDVTAATEANANPLLVAMRQTLLANKALPSAHAPVDAVDATMQLINVERAKR